MKKNFGPAQVCVDLGLFFKHTKRGKKKGFGLSLEVLEYTVIDADEIGMGIFFWFWKPHTVLIFNP